MAGFNLQTAPGVRRLYLLCLYFGIGASVWGYNIGIWSSILVHPGWRETLDFPTPAVMGTIVSVYYVGTLISYVLISHPLSDWLGRRYAALSGTGIVCLGAALQALSSGAGALGMMMSGRLVSGLGVAIVSTSVPLYQAEISPANKRGHFVTMNHVGFIAGMATGLWVGYFMRFWKSASGVSYGWRVSIFLELIPALIFGAGLPWIPETPRWLVENDAEDQARSNLRWLREGIFSDEQVEHEFNAIVRNVDEYHTSGHSWLSLFREKALFARLWRATLLQFMAQICGATAIKYYLPYLFEALGVEVHVALMAGAVEMTVKIGFTVLEMFIIDRFGRRNCLAAGCVVMALSMLINAVLPIAYPKHVSKAADIICIAFIFIYALGYSLGFGPAAWVYNTEIFPTSVRARGLNFAAAGASIGSLIVSKIWPLAIDSRGSGVYFFFMVVNIICIAAIFAFYPETKGRELEDMDALFGGLDKQRHDPEGLSEHLVDDEDAPYRDSEDSMPDDGRDQRRDTSPTP